MSYDKKQYTFDAAYAIAALLGFDAFTPVGDNKVRFYCSKMPTITKTQTSVEIIDDRMPQANNLTRSRASRLLPPARRRTGNIFDELNSMPSLYEDIRISQPQPQPQKRTINTNTTQINFTPDPLVPIDLVLPADCNYTSIDEIYNCLKSFFDTLLKKINSTEPINSNPVNIERLRDAAVCFLKSRKNEEGDSGIDLPFQIAMHGIYRGPNETCLGAIRSLQYYNQFYNSREMQLVNFIYNNCNRLFNNPTFKSYINDPELFDWILKQILQSRTCEELNNIDGNYIVEEVSLRNKVVDLLNGVAEMIWPAKKKK